MTPGARWRAARTRRWLRACTQVGAEPQLAGRPTIEVEGGRLLIGDRFRLASAPVPSHLAAGRDALLRIGDDVAIGCGAAIAAHQQVSIGDGTRIGPYVIIMDTNFHGASGDQSLQHDCRPVFIGAGCRIGSRVTITRGATIGDGAEILAGSVVSAAIPPGVCAGGARARIIGRAGDPASRWDSPAALLPEILMASLELETPPDLDGTALPSHLWAGARLPATLQAIEERLGLVLDHLAARDSKTFADLATLVRDAPRSR